MTNNTRINGGCHCGNIRLAIDWPPNDTDIGIRECSCSFCQKHGGAWTSHQAAAVTVTADDTAQLSMYRFGTGTADFWVCSNCGVVPIVTCETDGELCAVVNVNSFADVPGFTFSRATTDFDGEGTDDRLARRKRNWIPNVSVT